jgi:hypothetical protein
MDPLLPCVAGAMMRRESGYFALPIFLKFKNLNQYLYLITNLKRCVLQYK